VSGDPTILEWLTKTVTALEQFTAELRTMAERQAATTEEVRRLAELPVLGRADEMADLIAEATRLLTEVKVHLAGAAATAPPVKGSEFWKFLRSASAEKVIGRIGWAVAAALAAWQGVSMMGTAP